MSDLINLMLLLALVAGAAVWLQLSAARERAVTEARRICTQYELQLLDETVGLRGLGLRRVNGLRRVERCYGFEVSTDGDDRKPGRLWMIERTMTRLSLPTVESKPSDAVVVTQPVVAAQTTGLANPPSNVIPFRPRRPSDRRLH